jgi:hypothetical protein
MRCRLVANANIANASIMSGFRMSFFSLLQFAAFWLNSQILSFLLSYLCSLNDQTDTDE